MANDPKQYQEEEYLFSDDEANTQASEEPSMATAVDVAPEKNSFWKMWRKNIIVGAGLIIVVFIVYKVISTFFVSNETRAMPQVPMSAKTSLPSNVVSNSMPATPVMSAMSPPVTNNAASLHDSVNLYNQNRQENQQLTQLEATTQNIGSEISNLQDTTQSLQASIVNINSQLSQLNTALTTLTNQMQVQENRWSQLQKKQQKKPMPKPVVKQETYQTLAVIPGRAWLKSSKGATITVGVGTVVPGYGKVVMIDTQSGSVVTESGSIIQFAPSDE